jgi:aspartyl-tRNA(Asn)/glutamyl-tRNA(Gln) amidotransferase subunit C
MSSMKIDDRMIAYLADLARLELGEEEKESLKKDLADILNYVAKLEELDTEGVPELTHPFAAENRFREDVVVNGDRAQELIKIAPDSRGRYFKVPRTVEE